MDSDTEMDDIKDKYPALIPPSTECRPKEHSETEMNNIKDR